jgi:hypothetical protein
VLSAGPDGEYGVFFDSSSASASDAAKHNNPYSRYDAGSGSFWRGTPTGPALPDPNSEGGGHLDNITNHENLGARR